MSDFDITRQIKEDKQLIYQKYDDIKDQSYYTAEMSRLNNLHVYNLERLEKKRNIMRLPKFWMFLFPLIIFPLCGRYLASGNKKYFILCIVFLCIALFIFIGAVLDIKFMQKRLNKIDLQIESTCDIYERQIDTLKAQDKENNMRIECRKKEIDELYNKYRSLISYNEFINI